MILGLRALSASGIVLLALFSTACGDDESGSGGSGGATSSSGGTTTTAGTGGSGDGGAGDGGAGGGSTGDGGAGGAGEDADIEAACASICAARTEIECVDDEQQCTDGCVAESDIDDCRADLIAYYQCEGQYLESCDEVPADCVELGDALETCLAQE